MFREYNITPNCLVRANTDIKYEIATTLISHTKYYKKIRDCLSFCTHSSSTWFLYHVNTTKCHCGNSTKELQRSIVTGWISGPITCSGNILIFNLITTSSTISHIQISVLQSAHLDKGVNQPNVDPNFNTSSSTPKEGNFTLRQSFNTTTNPAPTSVEEYLGFLTNAWKAIKLDTSLTIIIIIIIIITIIGQTVVTLGICCLVCICRKAARQTSSNQPRDMPEQGIEEVAMMVPDLIADLPNDPRTSEEE